MADSNENLKNAPEKTDPVSESGGATPVPDNSATRLPPARRIEAAAAPAMPPPDTARCRQSG